MGRNTVRPPKPRLSNAARCCQYQIQVVATHEVPHLAEFSKLFSYGHFLGQVRGTAVASGGRGTRRELEAVWKKN